MPRGRCRQQGPRVPIWAAANYANAHPWQQMDQASPGVACTPLVDPWIERPCCGDPVCVRTIMEQKSTASGAPGSQLEERGPLAGCMPSSRPRRVDFCWVPGSDPGTFDGSPWLLDRFLAQLGDYMSFRFEHYQDNTSRVYEILGRLTGRARAWAAPYLVGDLPLPDDYELFCRDLKEVVQDPNSLAEYHEAVPCPLPLASSRPPVSPQLPAVRQYLARFLEGLALNMGTAPRAFPATMATPAVSRSSSRSRSALPKQQLTKESTPGPREPPVLPSSACSSKPGPVEPASSQPEEAVPTPVPRLLESANSPAQGPDPAQPGDLKPQKTEEEVSETEGDQEVSSGTPQEVVEAPETPGEPPLSPGF
uniref:Uncharacterized protein C22orf29 n=1 Tax=Callithrix jacchus TaxID=9483 RepID=F6YST2_CALJA|nr:protein Bop [Callithrix jacchus]